MMKAIATITGILLLTSAISDFGNTVWSTIEGYSAIGRIFNNMLAILAKFMLGIFMTIFASNSKN